MLPDWDGENLKSQAFGKGRKLGALHCQGIPLIMCLYLTIATIRLKFSQRETVISKQEKTSPSWRYS